MRRLWIVPLVAVLFCGVGLANSAQAKRRQFANTTTLQGPLAQQFQPILRHILAAGLPVPKGGVFVETSTQPYGGAEEAMPDGSARIQVDMRDGPARGFHELGHALKLSDLQQQRFRAIMHDQRPYGEAGARDNGESNPPREQFAEAYRVLAQHPTMADSQRQYDHFHGNISLGYGFDPTFFQLRKIRKLIESLG